MSAWDLPTTVDVAGRAFAIRTDFRAVLDALAALADPELTRQEQYMACLQILYPRWQELPDANEALRAAFVFISGGKEEEARGPLPRLVDWEQDAALIAPAVDKVLGYSCRRCDYLHWWEFLGAFYDQEREFARENAILIKIRAPESAEDKAEKERLLELLGR